MGFIIDEGCCGLSLQESCLIIGIIYLALNIISCCTNLLLSFGIGFLLEPLLYIAVSISLILAALNADKDLLIPWIVAFTITCIIFLMLVLAVIGAGVVVHLEQEEDQKQTYKQRFKMVLIVFGLYLLKFVIEIIIFSYVLSYYKQLDARDDIQEMSFNFE